jgi:hypothetical protein
MTMRKFGRKRNVTITLDGQTIRKAKIIAARRSTSISKLLSRQIEILADEEDYERAERQAIVLLDRGFRMGGSILAIRDNLHGR